MFHPILLEFLVSLLSSLSFPFSFFPSRLFFLFSRNKNSKTILVAFVFTSYGTFRIPFNSKTFNFLSENWFVWVLSNQHFLNHQEEQYSHLVPLSLDQNLHSNHQILRLPMREWCETLHLQGKYLLVLFLGS